MELLALLLATVDPSEVWMIGCYAIGLARGALTFEEDAFGDLVVTWREA